jgi:hypothetical protein
MAERTLTAKEQSTIEYYCSIDSDTHNNWGQSCLKAGYSKCKGWEVNAMRVHNKDIVIAGIEAYKAKSANKTARTVESVDDMYNEAYDLAKTSNQPSAMVSAVTGIARLYGMDKDTQTTIEQPVELDANQLDEARKQVKALRLVKDQEQTPPQQGQGEVKQA